MCLCTHVRACACVCVCACMCVRACMPGPYLLGGLRGPDPLTCHGVPPQPTRSKPEVKVSLYLLPFWRYTHFKMSGCELSLTTSRHRIYSWQVSFESSYPN